MDQIVQSETTFVAVPVPAEHVLEVMAYIAGLSGGGRTRPATVEAVVPGQLPQRPVEEDAAPGAWTSAELHRLATSKVLAARTASSIMDVLADAPGRWFSTTELEERTGIDRKNLKGSLSALTRHLGKHYGLEWPFRYQWGPEMSPELPHEAHYVINEDRAEAWQAVRNKQWYIDYPGDHSDERPIPDRLYDSEDEAIQAAVAVYRDSDTPKVIVAHFPTHIRVATVFGDRSAPEIQHRQRGSR